MKKLMTSLLATYYVVSWNTHEIKVDTNNLDAYKSPTYTVEVTTHTEVFMSKKEVDNFVNYDHKFLLPPDFFNLKVKRMSEW